MDDYAPWIVLAILLFSGLGMGRAERRQANPSPRPTGIPPVVIARHGHGWNPDARPETWVRDLV